MTKRADYCPRCKETEIEPVLQKEVGSRETGGSDSPDAEGTPRSVPSEDQS